MGKFDDGPLLIENRQFVGYEEEDIWRLNEVEERKFQDNPVIQAVQARIEEEVGQGGHWEKHWLSVDDGGRRMYTHIYYGKGRAVAVTSDGRIAQDLTYQE